MITHLKHLGRTLLPFLLLILAACSTLDTAPRVSVDRNAEWVLVPFTNTTETPLAGQRAEAVVTGLAQSLGIARLQAYPQKLRDDNLFEAGQGKNQEQAMAWARERGARYALGGTVQEWRYKVGVDGEPAVGLTLQITDLSSGQVIWSGAGARSGWSREPLAGVAQKLTRQLLQAGIGRY